MPARKARGAIVEKGEEACKVIGDYLNNLPNTQKQLWELDFCGSWLACDADTSVHQSYRGDAIAGKPAPTQALLPQDLA